MIILIKGFFSREIVFICLVKVNIFCVVGRWFENMGLIKVYDDKNIVIKWIELFSKYG